MPIKTFISKFQLLFLTATLLLHLVLLINTQFALWPEMVVYPYLMNNDFQLYKDLVNPYPPTFLVFLEGFSKLFGYQTDPYKIFTWLVIILTDIIIFLLSKKIFKTTYLALTSLLFFLFLSVPLGINGLWFDLVQTPIILLAIFFTATSYAKNKRVNLNLAVILLILATLIKQQAMWLLSFCLAYIFYQEKYNLIKVTKLLIPSIIFLIVTIFSLITILIWKNIFGEFLDWVIVFPLVGSKLPGYILLPTFKQSVLVVALALTIFLAAQKNKKEKIIFGLSAVTAFLFAYPRFEYFHLITTLALIAIIFPSVLLRLKTLQKIQKFVFMLSLVFLIFFSAKQYKDQFGSSVRFFESDTLVAASFINFFLKEEKVIYIQNGPDQLYPLTNTLPPKPWADEFSWYLERSNLQQKITKGIEDNDVRVVIYKPYGDENNYALGSYRPKVIASYIESNYKELATISDTLWLKVRRD